MDAVLNFGLAFCKNNLYLTTPDTPKTTILAMYSQAKFNLIVQAEDIDSGNLYLGSLSSAKNLSNLQAHEINAVLTIIQHGEYQFAKLQPLYQHAKINHIFLPLQDHEQEDIKQYFDKSYSFIQKHLETGNVLVHCLAGISRSSTLVIHYVMRKHGWDYQKAYEFVQSKRSVVRPNEGFREQLKEWYQQNKAKEHPQGEVKQDNLGQAETEKSLQTE